MKNIGDILLKNRPLAAVLTDDLASVWALISTSDEELTAGTRVVRCRCDSVPPLGELLDQIVQALAMVALADWPNWYGLKLPADISGNAFERNIALRDQLQAVCRQHLNVSPYWLRQAAEQCLRNEPPVQAGAISEIQAGQLSLAISRNRLVIVLGPASITLQAEAGSLIAAAEWLNRVTGASILLLLPIQWRHDLLVQRVTFGCEELILGGDVDRHKEDETPASGLTVTASPLPGRPHPNSPTEQELCRRIEADPELAPLLQFNCCVAVDLGEQYRIDLLCRDRRVAIEIDGDDHLVRLKYINDRERDYRLMKQGYLVLRLHNDLIRSDPQMAIERIRDIVRYRDQSKTKGN